MIMQQEGHLAYRKPASRILESLLGKTEKLLA